MGMRLSCLLQDPQTSMKAELFEFASTNLVIQGNCIGVAVDLPTNMRVGSCEDSRVWGIIYINLVYNQFWYSLPFPF